jgi:uncharacterized protein (TIGR03435 family)
MTLSRGRCRVLFCVVLACGVVRGQAPTPKDGGRPEYEVATIKPANPNGGHIGFESFPGGRIDMGNANLKMLLYYAYDVTEAQVVDATSWGSSKKFSIVIQPNEDSPTRLLTHIRATPNEEQRGMLRALLEERFGLKMHMEDRVRPVYILSRGKKQLMLTAPEHEDADPRGGVFMMPGGVVDGTAMGSNMTMEALARSMSSWLELPVVDQTGLKGSYDFRLTADDPTNHDMLLGCIRAMDRLGLQLKAGKAPVKTVVVDAVSLPSEN